MERINEFDFYTLGHIVHQLTEIPDDFSMETGWFSLHNAKTWLQYLLNGALIPIAVSASAANDLLNELKKALPNLEKDSLEKKLSTYDIYRIERGRRKLLKRLSLPSSNLSQRISFHRRGFIRLRT